MVFGVSFLNFMTCTSKPIDRNILSRYSSDLSSYTSACENDPNLQSFDSSFRELVNGFISSLSAGGETQSSTSDPLINVYEFLFQLYQETVKFIAENRDDVWKNEHLRPLVDAYFNNTQTILEFCNTVQNCVEEAKLSQLLIQIAVEQFEKEKENGDGMNENEKKRKYSKTQEALNKFIAKENPFHEEFCKQYKKVYEEHLLLLNELHKQKSKLEKKLKKLQTWKRFSNVVFVSALVSALVFQVAAAEHVSPGLFVKIASSTGSIVSTGKWFNDMYKEYEKALKRQKSDVESIEMGVTEMNVPMENMRHKAEGLKGKIESIRNTVTLTVTVGEEDEDEDEDEVTLRNVMKSIKDNIDEFTLKIIKVGEAAVKCSDSIDSARLDVLEHIKSSHLPSPNSLAHK